jgi:hypothetical protein
MANMESIRVAPGPKAYPESISHSGVVDTGTAIPSIKLVFFAWRWLVSELHVEPIPIIQKQRDCLLTESSAR